MTDRDRMIVRIAALCHDMGKPVTTVQNEDGSISSKGHASEAEGSVKAFLSRIGLVGSKHASDMQDIIDSVLSLVKDHMVMPRELSDRGVRRLARRLAPATVTQLAALIRADRMGRGGRFEDVDDGDADELLRRANALNLKDSAPEPLVMGRHLIDLGVAPGKHMGEVLRDLFEQQLDGNFTTLEGGLEIAQNLI